MITASETGMMQQTGEIGPGHVLGRYELLLPIAAGGMAMVWAARLKGTRGFQKIVAVKTMLPKLSEDEQFEQMFLDEASLASEIHHPHVVEILDLGEQSGVLFLVMEWIDGVPLNQLMKAARSGGGVPISVAVRVAMQACAGLHAAHELKNAEGKLVGLVHRDVSPQNVLVTYDGVAKVVDFGVAKATALGGGATVAGQIKGKVAYMAPEQVKGGAIDRRVDVFAMGIVLYALTTGKHPFRRESEAATMYNICAPQPVMPPRKVVAGYPAELERVLLQALAKDPDRRFQTANEMLKALDQLPSSLRASTDEEVALFVRSLFGAKREERQVALSHALVRADEIAKNAVVAPFPIDPLRQSVASSVSAVSRTGITGVDISGVPTVTGTGVVTVAGQISVRRRIVISAAAASALLLLIAVVIALLRREPEPRAVEPAASAVPQPSIAQGSQVASAKGAPANAPSAPPSASAKPKEAISVSELPSAKPSATVREVVPHAPRVPVVQARPPTNQAVRTTPAAAATATGAGKKAWMHDPGF